MAVIILVLNRAPPLDMTTARAPALLWRDLREVFQISLRISLSRATFLWKRLYFSECFRIEPSQELDQLQREENVKRLPPCSTSRAPIILPVRCPLSGEPFLEQLGPDLFPVRSIDVYERPMLRRVVEAFYFYLQAAFFQKLFQPSLGD